MTNLPNQLRSPEAIARLSVLCDYPRREIEDMLVSRFAYDRASAEELVTQLIADIA
jgi:hypothetical protein